jgi:hypothetical protein
MYFFSRVVSLICYRCENGCKWRALLERVYTALVQEGLLDAGVYCLDSAAAKVHPDAQRAEKKTACRQ